MLFTYSLTDIITISIVLSFLRGANWTTPFVFSEFTLIDIPPSTKYKVQLSSSNLFSS